MESSADRLLLEWSSDTKMFLNRRMWKSFLLVLGIPLLVLAGLLALLTEAKNGAILLGGGFALFAVLWALALLIMDATGAGRASYRLSEAGVGFAAGRAARNIADAALLAGMLAGKPGAMGAGMLARAEQDNFIAWGEVKRVTVSQASRYIEIRATGFLVKPIGLNCTADNFTAARDIIAARVGDKLVA